ncbi:MAG: undecaprenyl-diphosphatase [Burkholderia sp.]|nr:undecaprenyl-diphosphatase [Burkholderia sp.]
MENLNFKLFFAINAGITPQPSVAKFAIFIANWVIYIIPVMLFLIWLMSVQSTTRYKMIEASLASCVSLIAARIFSLVWFSPRSFMINIGTQLVPHTLDNSFPSDHMTFAWSIASSLLIYSKTRTLGAAIMIVGIAIGWARIYVGVHWPFDIIGGVLAGTVGALVVHLYAQPVAMLVSRISEKIHAAII